MIMEWHKKLNLIHDLGEKGLLQTHHITIYHLWSY